MKNNHVNYEFACYLQLWRERKGEREREREGEKDRERERYIERGGRLFTALERERERALLFNIPSGEDGSK